ncbi:MAG: DUF1751 domain-containing protein [Epsilonproteobacteria bacterium]|nr:MAG: DUF1751 domain-containing protein [Campylobacterota bacterium]
MFGLNFLFVEYNFFWQPLSTMFMHATLMHIVMNMVILFQFGTLIEQTYGPKILFLLFFIGGVMTSLASFAYIYIFNMTSHNIVGASGAISVLIGFVAFVDKTKTKVMLIWVLAISFLPLLMGLNIAWYSHLAGFGIGYIAGSKAEKKYLDI